MTVNLDDLLTKQGWGVYMFSQALIQLVDLR